MILAVALALASDPAELAPGAPELLAAERRLRELLATADATATATSRLQAAWTVAPTPKTACDDPARLEIGWRIERFGSAWREAEQAARAQADRVRRMRAASTVAPLVDAAWTARLDRLLAEAKHGQQAFLEASAWESLWVRPALAACVASPLAPIAGIDMPTAPVKDAPVPPVAVIGMGDGWVCPAGLRGDDAVVLVDGAACWSASPTCGCAPQPVAPGAVLGPAAVEAEGAEAPAAVAVPQAGARPAAPR